jgi:hypothetical protein
VSDPSQRFPDAQPPDPTDPTKTVLGLFGVAALIVVLGLIALAVIIGLIIWLV